MACYNKIQAKKKPPKKLLKSLYVDQWISAVQIADQLNISTPTVYYWLRKYGMHVRTHSEIARVKNPSDGVKARKKMSEKAKKRWLDPEYRENIINKLSGRNLTEEHKLKISESLIENQYRKGIPHTPEDKEKMSRASKRNWKKLSYVRKVMDGLQYKPNKSELLVKKLIDDNGLPFDYVGDGKMVIDGKCPDFISRDGSKIIEVFGEPWHDPNHTSKMRVKPGRTEKDRIKFFNERGYKCLILWHKELSDEKAVLEKLKSFNG